MSTPTAIRSDIVAAVIAIANAKGSRRDALKFAAREVASHHYIDGSDIDLIIDGILDHWA